MNKQEMLAKLNENRTKKLYKPEILRVDILSTIQVAKGDVCPPYFSLVYVPKYNQCYAVEHKDMPTFYDGKLGDSFGKDYNRIQISSVHMDILKRAVDVTKSHVSKNPSLQIHGFLVGWCLSKGLDLMEQGVLK